MLLNKTFSTCIIVVATCATLIGCAEYYDDNISDSDASERAVSSVYYYGSNVKLNEIKPHLYTKQNTTGNIIYDETAVRAFPDKRIALLYTFNRVPGMKVGVDLIDYTAPSQPIEFVLIGGKNLEDAMLKLFGPLEDVPETYGYIHHLNSSYFKSETGLGVMEVVTHAPVKPLKVERIHRQKAINSYVKKGAIVLTWKSSIEYN